MQPQALLDVRNLTVRFPHFEPVRDLSFRVQEGETLAIVGESGSGKSLTALTLMRLLPKAACIPNGQILFQGRNLLALSEREMQAVRGREIGLVFQEPMTSLNPVYTIGWQISEVLRQHLALSKKTARARAIELLDLVRIPDPHRRVDDFPHQLSGGMRQRVMIAMAIACEPRLLIADEPTTALDVTIQAQVLALLDSLRRDLRMGVLLITHDLGVVAQWADRVVVMYAGMQVEYSRPQPLFQQPLHPYTKGLLGASPRVQHDAHYSTSTLREIRGSILSAVGQAGCPFAPRCDLASDACRHVQPELEWKASDRAVACHIESASGCAPGAFTAFSTASLIG